MQPPRLVRAGTVAPTTTRAAADEGRWEIQLRNVPPTIRRLFDMTGVQAALPAETP